MRPIPILSPPTRALRPGAGLTVLIAALGVAACGNEIPPTGLASTTRANDFTGETFDGRSPTAGGRRSEPANLEDRVTAITFLTFDGYRNGELDVSVGDRTLLCDYRWTTPGSIAIVGRPDLGVPIPLEMSGALRWDPAAGAFRLDVAGDAATGVGTVFRPARGTLALKPVDPARFRFFPAGP